MASALDPFTASAADVQAYLSAGKLNSSQLISVYLDRIAKDNEYLKAVIAVTPRAVLEKEARKLDIERASGNVRGPLHGVPILLKDNIATHPDLGLDTTAGSYALAESRPRRNADVVERLIKAGAIILGKANLSEFGWYRSEGIPSAWSGIGGQGQSAYVRGGFRDDDSTGGHSNPGGSSSGSAVGVSAGFAPFSIGTETIGSLVMPADRAALFTLKPTLGLVSQDGIVPISHLCDSAGPLAKTAQDVAQILDVIIDPSRKTPPESSYADSATGSWDGIKVGVLKPEDWYLGHNIVKYEKSATDQMTKDIEAAYSTLESTVESFKHVTLISLADATSNGDKDIGKLFDRDFRRLFEEYLGTLDNSLVHSLDDLIEFNKRHADLELPERYDNQKGLLRAASCNISDQQYEEILEFARHSSRARGIDKTLEENDINVIVGPADSFIFCIAGAAGYPLATLPLSYLDFNGRPFGLVAVATAHHEALLIQFQSAWEATFPKRQPPPLFEGKSSL